MVEWQIFRNFIVDNQKVMNKIKPLGQVRSIGARMPNHTAKVTNKFDRRSSILAKLQAFATALSFKIASRFQVLCYFIAGVKWLE